MSDLTFIEAQRLLGALILLVIAVTLIVRRSRRDLGFDEDPVYPDITVMQDREQVQRMRDRWVH